MKTWHWLILILVLVGLALGIGYYLSTLKKAYTNRDKIEAGINIADNLGTLFG